MGTGITVLSSQSYENRGYQYVTCNQTWIEARPLTDSMRERHQNIYEAFAGVVGKWGGHRLPSVNTVPSQVRGQGDTISEDRFVKGKPRCTSLGVFAVRVFCSYQAWRSREAVVRATAGRATRTSGRAQTSRGSEGLVYYEIIDYIINAPSRGSEEERMGIPCWWRYI